MSVAQKRRNALADLLSAGFAGTQTQIGERLASLGYKVTEATVSRDLDALSAVRTHTPSGIVWSLPDTNHPPAQMSSRLLSDAVLAVTSSPPMLVVKTWPGMASAVASAIDAASVDGLAGTIAGDDTVFAVVAPKSDIKTIIRKITGD